MRCEVCGHLIPVSRAQVGPENRFYCPFCRKQSQGTPKGDPLDQVDMLKYFGLTEEA
jgi:hypothetical protein